MTPVLSMMTYKAHMKTTESLSWFIPDQSQR